MRKELEHALRSIREQGIQEARVVLLENSESQVQYRNGQAEQIRQSSVRSLAITMWDEGREGFFYTNDTTPEQVSNLIRRSAQTTRLLQPDSFRGLPDASRYYHGTSETLNNYDYELPTIGKDQKLSVVRQMDSVNTPQTDSRIISTNSSYSDRIHRAWYADTNGLDVQEQSSRATITQSITVNGHDGQHPMDGWGQTRIGWNHMGESLAAQAPEVCTTALRRTLNKIGQHPISSGTYTMMVESPVAEHLLQPILNALAGQALWQGTSFLKDCLHQRVVSPLFTLVDDPQIPGTRGSTYFDYDGVRTQRRVIFQDGILQTYFLDTPNSRRLQMEPTTQGVHHLILSTTESNGIDITQADQQYILVTDFNGGNCDPTTGKFSYGIEGFLMQGSVILQPISGMNITGDMLSLWQNLIGVGNDADPWEVNLIPSLTFQNVQFGGV